MRMYDLINQKKKGNALSPEEIRFMVEGYTKGTIPDYQMSAMMMAICFQGMNEEETLALTLAMRDSGEVLDLSRIDGIRQINTVPAALVIKLLWCWLPWWRLLGYLLPKCQAGGWDIREGPSTSWSAFRDLPQGFPENSFTRM